jgi:nucleoside-diphosphate-sugar epimerase
MLIIAAEAAGRKPPRLRLSSGLVQTAGRVASRLGIPGTHHLSAIRRLQPLDTTRAREELGLPEPIPFEQTCRDTLEWFSEHGYLKAAPPTQPAPEQPTQEPD